MARKADHHARALYCEHIGTMERSSLPPSHVPGGELAVGLNMYFIIKIQIIEIVINSIL